MTPAGLLYTIFCGYGVLFFIGLGSMLVQCSGCPAWQSYGSFGVAAILGHFLWDYLRRWL